MTEVKTIQTKTSLDNLLEGYKQLKPSNFKKINSGDRLRYFVDKEFKYGGVVKMNKYPDYIVLLNPRLKKTWCLQLKQPKLIVYHIPLETIQKENKVKNDLYKKFLAGKLIEK